MFLNLSNHPSALWSAEQLAAAEKFGKIEDMSFPAIEPGATEDAVATLVDEYAAKIVDMNKNDNITVHLMGEMTFTYALVKRLQQVGINCVASTTERITSLRSDGVKEVKFQFVKFRRYEK